MGRGFQNSLAQIFNEAQPAKASGFTSIIIYMCFGLFDCIRNSRVTKWPLMGNASQVNIIVLFYLLFVKVLGPAYMKNRQPYDFRKLMIFYNFGIMLYSTWMFYKFGKHGWFGKYNWLCEPTNYYKTDEDAMGMVTACWHFFISKIIELLDTVFFVLRKKDSQVTFLHVFHHSLLPLTTRFGINHAAAGYITITGFVNTFVHMWMYMYYGLAALGPSMQKYLWWKKHLTKLQILQFLIILMVMVSHVIMPGCEANAILIALTVGQAIAFLVLFAAFYKSNYRKSPNATVTDSSLERTTLPRKKTSLTAM